MDIPSGTARIYEEIPAEFLFGPVVSLRFVPVISRSHSTGSDTRLDLSLCSCRSSAALESGYSPGSRVIPDRSGLSISDWTAQVLIRNLCSEVLGTGGLPGWVEAWSKLQIWT